MVTEIMRVTETSKYCVNCISINNTNTDIYINKSHSERNGFFIGKRGGNMEQLKLVGIIEKPHGHKGAVKVKPVNGMDLKDLKNVHLIDKDNNFTIQEIFEVKKYRRGRYLLKFVGPKWRNEIEGLTNFALAI
jgi:hypothetical protein